MTQQQQQKMYNASKFYFIARSTDYEMADAQLLLAKMNSPSL